MSGLLLRRRALDDQYRVKSKELNCTIGRMLGALRRQLGAPLKEIAGKGCPDALSTLSELFNGNKTWTADKASAVLEKLRAREQQQQKAPR